MAKNKIFTPRFLAEAGIIAALYFVLTIINPLAFGPVQIRFSEALCVLPFFTPAAVPGLFIGCVLSNLAGSPFGIYDIVFGSLATLFAAFLAYVIGKAAERKTSGQRNIKWLVPLPAVIINAFVIAAIIYFLDAQNTLSYWVLSVYIGIGQALACYCLGMPLIFILGKYKKIMFK